MTNTTRTMLSQEVLNTSTKATTATRKLNNAQSGRKQYELNILQMELEAQANALQETLTSHASDNLSILSTIITIHGLKVASRGRLLKDNNGKPQKDENGNPRFTPANIHALRILQNGIHDTSGILDDLTQSVALVIWEAITQGKASIITNESGNLELKTTDENAMKQIYNTVQNYLYSTQHKHYKRQYIPVIDENGKESAEMVTKAMRQYAMSIEAVGQDELFQSLTAILDERETAILWSKTEQKQVQRNYTSNGKQHKHYVSRCKTVAEISTETGYTVKQVRNTLKSIQGKLKAVLAENEKPTRIKATHQHTNHLAWIFG